MGLVSFEMSGARHVGMVDGDDVLVITDAAWTGGKTLRAIIGREELGEARAPAKERVALTALRLLPPLFDPPRAWCVGVNYHEHRIEMGRDPAKQPTIFSRTAQSQVGHCETMAVPAASTQMDYEAEIEMTGVGVPANRAV